MRALLITITAVASLAAIAARADAKGCHERSWVVGYEHCSRFGDWSRDQDVIPMVVEAGWLHRDYTIDPFQLSGGRSAPAQRVIGNGFVLRVLGGTRIFYTGVEFDYAYLTQAPDFANTNPITEELGVLAVAGAHASLWRLAGGIEFVAGYQHTTLDYCPTNADCADEIGQSEGQVGARAHATLFLTPHLSAGVAYGHSLIERGDSTVMLTIGGHFAAIDAMY